MNTAKTANQKALQLNLDETIYGTFAEIGAGQDVAGIFFKAGAASGTVAKSISAYDMTFSDEIYGKETSGRYVCQSRVEKMLDYEYDLLQQRLREKFPERKFFVYANTVSARNYHGTNDPNGWIGVKFQRSPAESASMVVMHVRMHDNTNLLQQKAIGVLGVNLVHACYQGHNESLNFLDRLMDNLSRERVEIDMIKVSGPAFETMDNRVLNLQLIVRSYTDAIMFNESGAVCLAKDELYKKNIVLTRGSYRPPTKVNMDILKTGQLNFSQDVGGEQVVSLAEITINHLKEDGELTQEDFLARVDLLNTIGQKVLITNLPQFFRLSNYLSNFKPKNVGLVMGVYNFMQIFNGDYQHVNGGILEALGRVFRPYTTIYLYPYREASQDDQLINLSTVNVEKEHKTLLDHLVLTKKVKDLVGYDDKLLHIYSRKVLTMIRNNETGWEELVPKEIAKTINDKCLFGHPCEHIIK
ncbi:MAG: nicotinate-nucleotide adenylyltransferase [Halobacteriovoraceae bacterium]|nr:nicotinate-nucleotide adenylyltransferase [Halobacteriovoraceae bacterium]|tara:strand:+ start:9529 stop:10938 length:1410 start_codon:yes stop_codon:yes gene_type:complete